MQVRNKETGEVETLRHGPATDAVTAGTHEFVNVAVDDDGLNEAKVETAKPVRLAKAEK